MRRPKTAAVAAPACLLAFSWGVAAQTSISVNPQQITFSAPSGSPLPVKQTLTVATTGQNAPFAVAVRYLGAAADWLSVNPTSGTAPATVTLTADASKLAAGSYLAQVLVSAGTIGTYANVMFTVDPGPGGVVGQGSGAGLIADPTLLTFIGAPGNGILTPQTVAVRAARGAPAPIRFTATASSPGNWLSVIQSSPATTPGTLTVVADQSALAAGNYTGTITIAPAAGGTAAVVPVVLAAAGPAGVPGSVTLTQTAVAITHQVGTPVPPLQVIGVDFTPGSYPPAYFTASTTTSWLRLTSSLNPVPAAGLDEVLPGEFNLFVDPAGLVAGTYVGVVDVSASGLQAKHLLVTLTVTTVPALNASPSSVSFNTSKTTAEVTLSGTGASVLPFTAAVSQGTSWLSVTPSSGNTTPGSGTLTITANPAGLIPGTYEGAVNVSLGSTGSIFKIPAVLTIAGTSAGGALEVPTAAMELAGVSGLPGPSGVVNIGPSAGSTAAQDFTASASSAEGWLGVTPFVGSTGNGLPARLTITGNPAAVSPGTYQGTVTVTSLSSGAQASIPVRFTVAQKAIMAVPASLTFTQDQKGVAPPPQTVQITANSLSPFTVTTTAPWVRVDRRSGTAGAADSAVVLTVSVDPTGFSTGTQSAGVVVSGPDNQLTVPVTLTVPSPALNVIPTDLSFAYELGGPAPPVQFVGITSTFEKVGFTAAAATESRVNWLNVDPPSGTTPSTVRVSVNTAVLVPGKHSGTITIASPEAGAAPRTITVTLTVTASPVSVERILHGAGGTPTPIAPGQIVTITGRGLGPLIGVTAKPTAAGAYDTRLADTRALFDGIPAPLLSVRFDQISAIVPYGVYGRISARVQVETGMSLSVPVEARVADAAPGLFVAGNFARGQAMALNADLTANSLANPAQRGSIIALFGTGEGQTDPPGQDGRVILTDLRHPLLPVSARIGGRPAEVTYAGSAADIVSGVFQVNVRIPEDAPAGSVPVELQVGTATTQAGVTVALR